MIMKPKNRSPTSLNMTKYNKKSNFQAFKLTEIIENLNIFIRHVELKELPDF